MGGLFAILPAAACYKRIWKEIAKTELPVEAVLNPEWVNAPYEIAFFYKVDSISPVKYARDGSVEIPEENRIKEACPIRMNKEDKIVPKFVELQHQGGGSIKIFRRQPSS